MSAHKPRRRKDAGNREPWASDTPNGSSNGAALDAAPFTLSEILGLARRTSLAVLLPSLFIVALLFRWTVGLWGYSGQGVLPMHGDFEAQRHWMEITSHLPAAKWYFYDLQYWGLDYPPLTAYHSWVLGKLGSLWDSSWFALDTSRGIESEGLKLYMRATAVGSDFIFYMPSAFAACWRLAGVQGSSGREAGIAFAALLMQPAIILIDHGHFQYNSVMLGLVLASIAAWCHDRYAIGCILFVGALAFKQMALYYAPAVFAYLLGVCIFPKLNITRFIIIATATALTFAFDWAPLLLGALYAHSQDPKLTDSLEPPFLYTAVSSALPFEFPKNSAVYVILLHLTQSIHRIFPLARGLFEDKVANIWLAVHTVFRLNQFPVDVLSRISLLATLAAILPSSTIIFLRPRRSLLPLALASSAWSFFLLSFQVHEKSVLLPLLPMTLLLISDPEGLGTEVRAWVGWANSLGAWTLYPLLKRDGQAVPYAAITLLWTLLLDLPPLRWELYRIDIGTPRQAGIMAIPLHTAFYIIMAIWHGCELFVEPPDRKPDLWVVLNCLIGATGFVICWLWCNGMLLYRSGLIDRWVKGDETEKFEKKDSKSLQKSSKDVKVAQAGGGKRAGTPSGTPKKKA